MLFQSWTTFMFSLEYRLAPGHTLGVMKLSDFYEIVYVLL